MSEREYWWGGSDEPLTRDNLELNARLCFVPRRSGDYICHSCSEMATEAGDGVTVCRHCWENFCDFAARILAGRPP